MYVFHPLCDNAHMFSYSLILNRMRKCGVSVLIFMDVSRDREQDKWTRVPGLGFYLHLTELLWT